MPGAKLPAVGEAASQPPLLVVARSLMMMDVGIAGVRGLLVKEPLTDMDWSPLGETVQVQHEIISSAGSKA
jgi:hypothetical protein